jgi:tripartite-type tricarboxylate transporter receptor subunit TctC
MLLPLRLVVAVCWRLALAVALAHSLAAHADYPAKTIRLVVPNAPGGAADATGRIFGAGLSQALGKQILIDNRAGAGGNIAAEIAAKAAPDGYTLLLVNVSHAVSVSLYSKLGYDLLKDFTPVSLLVTSPYGVTVHPSLPVRSIGELVALARARPDMLNYGSSANGTFLGGALLFDMTGIKLNYIAYKGGAPTLVALMSGEIAVALTSLSATLAQVRAGKLRVLAITAARRSPAAPDLPTVSESGVAGYEASSWYGLVVPAGTAQDIVTRLNIESMKLLRNADFRDRLVSAGLDPLGTSAEELAAYIHSEVDKWAKVVRLTGVRLD